MGELLDLLQWLVDGLGLIKTYIYDFLVWAASWVIIYAFKLYIALITFFWNVASQILVNLNLSSYINTAWASLDSQLLAYATYFRVPESLSLILQAGVTRITLVMTKMV